jgi:phenylacetic acid degradation protein
MFFEFKGLRPVSHHTSFIHPQASVIGDVIIGKNVFIGAGAVLRGDFGRIIIEDGCNVQENCVVHMFPGITVLLKEGAHIGHGAIIHGATIGRNCLVGMNTVVMDDVQVGDESILGALCFVNTGMIIPERSLVVGNPAKIIKQVSDEMIEWKTKGTEIYQQLAADCLLGFRECSPLDEEEENRKVIAQEYRTWNKSKTDT